MLIRIAIADTDTDYVNRITSVLETYGDINLSIYTDKHSLETALTVKKFDVLLFDAELFDGQRYINPSMAVVMLFDDEKPVPEYCSNFAKVRKYQRISNIYQQILGFYSEICGEMSTGVLGQDGTTLITFYSPAGGTGKTTMALLSSAKLASEGYRALYLNMEDIAAEDYYLPQNSDKGISELISILGSSINFKMKVQSILQNKADNFYYFNHFDSPGDFYEMTGEEMSELLKELERSGLFDFIIIDINTTLPDKLVSLFEAVQKIVLVENPDIVATRKMQRFLQQAHIVNEYGHKMKRVLNFDLGNTPDIDTEIPRIGALPYISSPDSSQLVDILIRNKGIQFITQLVNTKA